MLEEGFLDLVPKTKAIEHYEWRNREYGIRRALVEESLVCEKGGNVDSKVEGNLFSELKAAHLFL